MHSITRYHDFSAGHRVVGHENKCAKLHGHNYRIHFTCEKTSGLTVEELDSLGRVIDFSVMKSHLCMWLENNWDHKFLYWTEDPWCYTVRLDNMDPEEIEDDETGFLAVPFNPTAENMAAYLVTTIGPQQLRGTGVTLVEVTVDETRKCSATYGRVR